MPARGQGQKLELLKVLGFCRPSASFCTFFFKMIIFDLDLIKNGLNLILFDQVQYQNYT